MEGPGQGLVVAPFVAWRLLNSKEECCEGSYDFVANFPIRQDKAHGFIINYFHLVGQMKLKDFTPKNIVCSLLVGTSKRT